jgi:DnaK suppressor protein
MPLTATQRQHLERRLQEERARVVRDLAEFKQSTSTDDRQDRNSDLSKLPTHAADLGTDVQDEELDVSVATRQSAELSQIDDALERLASNPEQYGICENTGEEIPFARLDIIPWARTTVASSGNS